MDILKTMIFINYPTNLNIDTLTTVVDASVFFELFGTDASITDHSKLAVNSDEELEMMKMDGTYI